MWANRMLLLGRETDRSIATSQVAGLLMYRVHEGELYLLLVHPGDPYFRNQDLGTWTIPKGEIQDGESSFNAACLRFTEEIGQPAFGPFFPLTPAFDRSGSVIQGWAFEGNCDPVDVLNRSLTWPKAGGQHFAAVDRAGWFDKRTARFRMDPAQVGWIYEISEWIRAIPKAG